MYYGFPYYSRGFYPYYNPYWGFGGYGSGFGVNAIGSQFNSQSLVNTGTYTGSNQIQSPINIW